MKLHFLLLFSSALLLGAGDPYSEFLPTLDSDERKIIESGEILVREARAPGPQGKAYELVGLINASGESVFRVLAAYESYPQFMSTVEKVEIYADLDTMVTLNYTLKPIFGLSKRYRINIQSAELKAGVWKLEWYLIPWPGLEPLETLEDTKGYWLIIEEEPGRSLLQYYAYSDPGPLPLGLRGVVNALSKNSLKDIFNETRGWAENQ